MTSTSESSEIEYNSTRASCSTVNEPVEVIVSEVSSVDIFMDGKSDGFPQTAKDTNAHKSRSVEDKPGGPQPKKVKIADPPSECGIPGGAGEEMNVCMQQIEDKAKDVHRKWKGVFKESEDFERLAIVRVDTLLKEAYAVKENLEAQKEALIARLKGVTSILEQGQTSGVKQSPRGGRS